MNPTTLAVAWIGILAGVSAAMSATPIANKTIVLDWVTVGSRTGEGGRAINFQNRITRTIYVSSQGRIFARLQRQSMKRGSIGSDTVESAPGDASRYGGARDAHFEGNSLIIRTQLPSGAFQAIATFDPSLTSCSVQVIYGRSGGQGLVSSRPGAGVVAVDSLTATSPTCSMTDGNPFN